MLEVGSNMSGISIGDRVACGGAGYANHAEINYVPKNLMVKIPDGVDDIDLTLKEADMIRDFEASHRANQPWLFSRDV